jgi:hypothetical protein
MKWLTDLMTTYSGNKNRNAIFGTLTFIAAFVYIFAIKPGDSVTFGVMLGAASVMLGLSIKEDGKKEDLPKEEK